MTASFQQINKQPELREKLLSIIQHNLLLSALDQAGDLASISVNYITYPSGDVGVDVEVFVENGYIDDEERDAQPVIFHAYSSDQDCADFRDWFFQQYGGVKGLVPLWGHVDKQDPIDCVTWAKRFGFTDSACRFSWTVLNEAGECNLNISSEKAFALDHDFEVFRSLPAAA